MSLVAVRALRTYILLVFLYDRLAVDVIGHRLHALRPRLASVIDVEVATNLAAAVDFATADVEESRSDFIVGVPCTLRSRHRRKSLHLSRYRRFGSNHTSSWSGAIKKRQPGDSPR